MATPIEQLAKRQDSSMKFQPVAKAERQKLALRGQEVQQARDQRRTLEAKAVDTSARKPGAVFEPVKVQLPKSPIVAKSASQLGRNQAPPKVQQALKPDVKFQPKPEPSVRPTSGNISNPQSQPRTLQSESKPAPGRSDVLPLDKRTAAVPSSSQVQKSAAAQSSATPASRSYDSQRETRKFAPSAPEYKPASRLQVNPIPTVRQPTQPKTGDQVAKPVNPPRAADQNLQPPARNNPPASDRNGSNPADKDRENKGRQ